MNTIINTNIMALTSHRAILNVGQRQAISSERLSTGMRINRAADDAAGLAISEKMRNQIRGLDQATRNSQDGISLIQTAEGALEEIHRILERTRELTNQAANDVMTSEDRQVILTEITQILEEIDRIAGVTEFNTLNLLDGSMAEGAWLQVGANAGQGIIISISNLSVESLGLSEFTAEFTLAIAESIDLIAGGEGGAMISALLNNLDDAIQMVSFQRAELGAIQNRLEHTINNLRVASENITAANARIRDTDMAREMMEYTQAGVLHQAAMSMLAQANMIPQSVLQLLS